MRRGVLLTIAALCAAACGGVVNATPSHGAGGPAEASAPSDAGPDVVAADVDVSDDVVIPPAPECPPAANLACSAIVTCLVDAGQSLST